MTTTKRCDGWDKPGCILAWAHVGECRTDDGLCTLTVFGADDLERRCLRPAGHDGTCCEKTLAELRDAAREAHGAAVVALLPRRAS